MRLNLFGKLYLRDPRHPHRLSSNRIDLHRMVRRRMFRDRDLYGDDDYQYLRRWIVHGTYLHRHPPGRITWNNDAEYPGSSDPWKYNHLYPYP